MSTGVGLDYVHRSFPVSTTPGFCAPNPMIEYTCMSRSPSITLKGPALPTATYSQLCQNARGTLNHPKLQGAVAWDVMENIASERRFFLDLHQKPEQQVQGIIMVKQRRSSSSLQRNYLPSDNGFTVLQCFFPQDIIMCFTSLNYCSHKSNAFRTLKCSHLGLSLQLYSDGVEGSGFCR